jgi:hypothetical protein
MVYCTFDTRNQSVYVSGGPFLVVDAAVGVGPVLTAVGDPVVVAAEHAAPDGLDDRRVQLEGLVRVEYVKCIFMFRH